MADPLGNLVLHGPKRATTSLAWIYDAYPEEKLPQIGDFNVILNAAGEPLCITETYRLEKCKFSEIDEVYAFTEGEGDRSLRHWREVHWKFFAEACEPIQRTPHEDMPVICEYFRLRYPEPSL